MIKSLILFLFLAPFTVGAAYNFDETVSLPLEHSEMWKRGRQASQENGFCLTHYQLKDESENQWSKLITIHFKDLSLVKGASAQEAMVEEQQKSPTVKCTWVQHAPDDLIYERSFPLGERELVRLIKTDKGIHRIAYVKKGPWEENERSAWTERLKKAKIQR